ncbi:YbhB/YbcL family Raf kinase inhibitor-like protein [Burkholderia oklahomensis]|uniref:YbhB/YbcL family Raf kinase inhibitor-like protein n=1 Tax=Burkholderia oklahomensis TaxID=342113 RepID=UPI00016A8A1A|nr:YbhB/YbcL family Raf kinase inhibitor-like protein [Burkholderia oklahomensis]AJX32025.1 phosphatidylethanolamine-binding family protein [Burkholderia oklahomensis C6786]AOI44558.1 phosphatidylethanolamine-binding protein [Burkholderia oklahomensis C6786]KUY54855.1 phosphatidylethanolamine-binding protein [Burkholderia oklahomensis C6786]MBI0359441.1 YbhB/YbcL family Raf kinase inhibitor-like protein [Burkholderia oklahomensis]SUW58533.1 putative kinase inhibitor [Burkholderia oklahomensis]
MRVGRRVVPPGSPRRLLSLALACVSLFGLLGGPRALAEDAFTLTSDDLRPGGRVGAVLLFNQGDCKGGNRSPQLAWRNPPPGTKGFAVTMFDPDAPGRGWWHWAVAGIPANVSSLPANASASGYLRKLGATEARNDFGVDGYGGPCPPPGKPHRYVITVYALKATDLRVATGRPAQMFDHEIGTETIGSAQLVVTYGR